MKLIKQESIQRLYIEYDNTDLKHRIEVCETLDEQFGRLNYKIVRCGPKNNDIKIGLMIVEVINEY